MIEKQITHAVPAILGYSNSLLATYVFYWYTSLETWFTCRHNSLNMRNYVKRAAVTPVDVINIMNPICLPPNQRASYPMPMRARAARVGYDVYHDEEKEELEVTGATERTMGASTFLRNSRQTSLRNGLF
jgi:hypothetical protein